MRRNSPASATLDFKALKLLCSVVAEGNLARAANRENMALSSASKRISNLETRLGVQLLNRHDRGAEPTAAALSVLPHIREAFDLLDRVVDELGEYREGRRGLVRLHAHTTAMTGRLPELVAQFMEAHPAIDITIDETTSGDIIHDISTGRCDLGVIAGTVAADGVELIEWYRDELVAALPAGHPLCAGEQVRMAELLEYPIICMQRDSSLVSLLRNAAMLEGSPLIEKAHVGSFEVARRMVACGLGISILPASAHGDPAKPGETEIRPIFEPWARRKLMLCVRNSGKATAATRKLLEFLVAARS